MKEIIAIFAFVLLPLSGMAQQEQKFSPEKFEAEMETFITKEAALTQTEAQKFFPLFREMHQKQRTLFERMRQLSKQNPTTENDCRETIKQCDKLNIEAKQIEQNYHNKMIKLLPATKVYAAIAAESRFHRQMMKGWQRGHGKTKERLKDKRH